MCRKVGLPTSPWRWVWLCPVSSLQIANVLASKLCLSRGKVNDSYSILYLESTIWRSSKYSTITCRLLTDTTDDWFTRQKHSTDTRQSSRWCKSIIYLYFLFLLFIYFFLAHTFNCDQLSCYLIRNERL